MPSIWISDVSSPTNALPGSSFTVSWKTNYKCSYWRRTRIFSRITWGTKRMERVDYVRGCSHVHPSFRIPGITAQTQFKLTVGYSD